MQQLTTVYRFYRYGESFLNIGHHVYRASRRSDWCQRRGRLPHAESLVDDGYRVAGLDIDVDNLRNVRERSPDEVRLYECDVSDSGDVDSAVSDVIDQWGRIDILVNNAAVAEFAPFGEHTMAATRREFETNSFGYLRMIHAVLPHMQAHDDGIIHNMGSGTGDIGHPGLVGYAATKGAIKAVTRSLTLELSETGISCPLMVPPTTDTRMSAHLEYPEWMRATPADVGRKLAERIESTGPVITPDWQTAIGLYLVRRFPNLWAKTTSRFVELEE